MARLPSAWALLLLAGAVLVVYSDMVNGDVIPYVSFHTANFGSSWGAAPGVKNLRVSFWVKATVYQSTDQDLAGTGLWQLSLSASKTNVASGAPDIKQSLSSAQSSTPLSGGVLHIKTDAVLSGMGGCDGDKAYVCFELADGDNPHPFFKLASPVRGCLKLPLQCKE
ncbi:uncharacterized protein [Asterias amurensis]|uniref:uncharacterized protein n=1 Tax=Asterias amurensis TaxID=7602 RepID=UPI003AB585A8